MVWKMHFLGQLLGKMLGRVEEKLSHYWDYRDASQNTNPATKSNGLRGTLVNRA